MKIKEGDLGKVTNIQKLRGIGTRDAGLKIRKTFCLSLLWL